MIEVYAEALEINRERFGVLRKLNEESVMKLIGVEGASDAANEVLTDVNAAVATFDRILNYIATPEVMSGELFRVAVTIVNENEFMVLVKDTRYPKNLLSEAAYYTEDMNGHSYIVTVMRDLLNLAIYNHLILASE